MKIEWGRTKPGHTNWKQYHEYGIFVDVDTSHANFPSTVIPIYITSIGGKTKHWSTGGATSIYDATAESFRIYVHWTKGGPLTVKEANDNEWHINWVGISE